MYLILQIQIQWKGKLVFLMFENLHYFFLFVSGKLEEEDTWFELSPRQQKAFYSLQLGYKLIRQQYHAIHDLLWLSGHTSEQLPKRYKSRERILVREVVSV